MANNDLSKYGLTCSEGNIRFENQNFKHWVVIRGRPHRQKIGEVLLRYALFQHEESKAILISGPTDRSFRAFLEHIGFTWVEIKEWNSFDLRPAMDCSMSLSAQLPSLGSQNSSQDDIIKFNRLLLEKDMEDFLIQHSNHLSEIIGVFDGITPVSQQHHIENGILDIVCKDKRGKMYIIECKRGGLHKEHLGQLIEYFRPKDSQLHGASLILLLYSSNPDLDGPLKRLGIEIIRLPLKQLVDLMIKENYSIVPVYSDRRQYKINDNKRLSDLKNEWKIEFIREINNVFPDEVLNNLEFNPWYKSEKKIRVFRKTDDRTVLYVGSNGNWLELGLPLLHYLLLQGVPVPIRTKGTAVFFSKGGDVPNITIEVKADDALFFISEYSKHMTTALRCYEKALDKRSDVLLHYGAVIQDNNASKAKADGVCRLENCPYCKVQNC